jgi:hypothetical protein
MDVPIGTGDGVPLSGMISIIVSYALPKAQAQWDEGHEKLEQIPHPVQYQLDWLDKIRG